MVTYILKQVVRKLFWSDYQRFLSDKQYAKIRYWLEQDGWLNLNDPQKFTEKIQYIKLTDRRERRRTFANRLKVRDYVSKKIGERFLIPLIGVYDDLTPEIWQSLPNQFVLKANHGSGMIEIVYDKSGQSYQNAYRQTEAWKSIDFYRERRQWAYKDLPRTIVAEKLMLDSSRSVPKDYKFFCFDGAVKIIQIDFDRFGDHRKKFLDHNFNTHHATLEVPEYHGTVKKPENLTEAIKLAETLADNINFLRVDLYLLEDMIYFGELTNYPMNGFVPFEPEEMELMMGSYLNL